MWWVVFELVNSLCYVGRPHLRHIGAPNHFLFLFHSWRRPSPCWSGYSTPWSVGWSCAQSLTLPCSDYSPYIIQNYEDPPTISSPRTYLYVLPTNSKAVRSVVAFSLKLRSYYFADRRHIPKSLFIAHKSNLLAHRLHAYSYIVAADLEILCRQAKILTPHL